jgi:hypothetical protein
MEKFNITGTVVDIRPIVEGISKTTGKKWIRQQLILKRPNGKYPFILAVTVFGDNVNAFKIGEYLTCYLGCELSKSSKDWEINNLSAYKIKRNEKLQKSTICQKTNSIVHTVTGQEQSPSHTGKE